MDYNIEDIPKLKKYLDKLMDWGLKEGNRLEINTHFSGETFYIWVYNSELESGIFLKDFSTDFDKILKEKAYKTKTKEQEERLNLYKKLKKEFEE